MKKTYITPEMLVERMDVSQNLLVDSPTVQLTGDEATTVEDDDQTYDTLVRHSAWNDEEE